MSKLNPLKFGIIGCSRIAKKAVIPAIIKSEFAELEMIGSRSINKSKEFSSEFNCKKNGTYDDVISDDSINVIYISTPIGTHEELIIPDYFIWVTLFQIKQLLKIENFVGPHIRGIISYL